MRIAIGADHGGYEFKLQLIQWLKSRDIEYRDFGTDSPGSCDYPDFGIPAAKSVSEGECGLGILICNNGIGMSILANKIRGIRAALVYNEDTARATKEHHDSNVLCLGGQEFSSDQLLRFVEIWLKSEYVGERHQRRIHKISELEK